MYALKYGNDTSADDEIIQTNNKTKYGTKQTKWHKKNYKWNENEWNNKRRTSCY